MANLSKAFLRWKEVILITLVVRGILLFYASFNLGETYNIFYPWVRWDGPHYLEIAKNWYQSSGDTALFIVFYPLYPLIVKIVTFLTADPFTSSILVSIIFSFAASIALFELTLLDYSKKVALGAVWFLNIFPTSYFLQASYTESLFLTVSILTVYFFRKKYFLLSGIFGLLSTLTRINGILLIPLLLGELKSPRSIISFTLLPIGTLIYLVINFFTFADPLYFTKPLTSNWYKHLEWPWIGINNLISSFPPYSSENFYIYFSELTALIFILIMAISIFFKIRKSYSVYLLANLLVFASTSFILSTPRYSLSLFPIFIALGLAKIRLQIILSIISIPTLLKLTLMYTQGRWAF